MSINVPRPSDAVTRVRKYVARTRETKHDRGWLTVIGNVTRARAANRATKGVDAGVRACGGRQGHRASRGRPCSKVTRQLTSRGHSTAALARCQRFRSSWSDSGRTDAAGTCTRRAPARLPRDTDIITYLYYTSYL